MKVMVTGGNGFLGSWVIRQLISDGHKVRLLHRPSSDLSLIKDLEFESILGDVTDLESLETACQGVDCVFHMAAVIGYSRSQRRLMERVNVGGTENVLKAAKNGNIQRIVYLSSVAAIGASFDRHHVLNESSPYNLHHLDLGYFETKRKAEEKVFEAINKDKLDVVILNPSTIYGHGDAQKGSRKVQLKVAQGRFRFYPPGGVNVIAVEDVVKAMMTAWQAGRSGQRYILAGENLTLRQLFELIADEAGVRPPSIRLNKPTLLAVGKVGDLMEKFNKKGPINSENAWASILFHWFDNSLARKELNLNPLPAKEAIRRSLEWSRQNGLLDKSE